MHQQGLHLKIIIHEYLLLELQIEVVRIEIQIQAVLSRCRLLLVLKIIMDDIGHEQMKEEIFILIIQEIQHG